MTNLTKRINPETNQEETYLKKIVFTDSEGMANLIIPSSKESINKFFNIEMNNTEYQEHIIKGAIPEYINTYEFIDDKDHPADREFRNAWKQNGKSIEFDLDKAKNIQLKNIRDARKIKLEDLDKQINGAILENNAAEKSRLAKERRELLDITEPLKAMIPSSIDDIKTAFPDKLKN